MGSTSNNTKRDKQRGREHQFWKWSKDAGKSLIPIQPKRKKPKPKKSAPFKSTAQLPGCTPHRLPGSGFCLVPNAGDLCQTG